MSQGETTAKGHWTAASKTNCFSFIDIVLIIMPTTQQTPYICTLKISSGRTHIHFSVVMGKWSILICQNSGSPDVLRNTEVVAKSKKGQSLPSDTVIWISWWRWFEQEAKPKSKCSQVSSHPPLLPLTEAKRAKCSRSTKQPLSTMSPNVNNLQIQPLKQPTTFKVMVNQTSTYNNVQLSNTQF